MLAQFAYYNRAQCTYLFFGEENKAKRFSDRLLKGCEHLQGMLNRTASPAMIISRIIDPLDIQGIKC